MITAAANRACKKLARTASADTTALRDSDDVFSAIANDGLLGSLIGDRVRELKSKSGRHKSVRDSRTRLDALRGREDRRLSTRRSDSDTALKSPQVGVGINLK